MIHDVNIKKLYLLVPGHAKALDRVHEIAIDPDVTPRDIITALTTDPNQWWLKVDGAIEFLPLDRPVFPHVREGAKLCAVQGMGPCC